MPAISLAPPPKAAKDEEAVRGWDDVRLDREGISEAHRIGRALKGRGIGIFICSDLPRAHETCKIFSEESKIPIAGTSKDLRTWGLGELEGSGLKDAKKIVQYYWDVAPYKAPKGGESADSFVERVIPKLNQIIDVSLSNNVIIGVVTHHWVVDLALRAVESSKGNRLPLKFDRRGMISDKEDPPGSVYDMRFEGNKISMPLVPPGTNFYPGPVLIRHEQTSQN